MMLQERLLEHLRPRAAGRVVADVRIGLGYTAVRLDGGPAGLAWTPGHEAACCTHVRAAGTLAGQPAAALLDLLVDPASALSRALGLATANALLAAPPHPAARREDVLELLSVGAGERVAMVGYFGPLVAPLRAAGCHLDIVELRPRPEATLTPEQGRAALAACDVAILTATALINGTCDSLLESLGRPRAAVLLGPSTPMCPEAFRGTPVTLLAGARVREPEPVLRIVSEGGGTQVLKRHLDFETVPVDAAR